MNAWKQFMVPAQLANAGGDVDEGGHHARWPSGVVPAAMRDIHYLLLGRDLSCCNKRTPLRRQ